MTLAYSGLNRMKPLAQTVWPVGAMSLFAALAVIRELPAGYVRAAVALPIILVIPGLLTVCAIFGQRSRPTGTTFTGYVILLSVAWMAFVSLGLYGLRILITATSTYWALLLVCGILTVVDERRLLLERQTDLQSLTPRQVDERRDIRPDRSRPLMVLGGTLSALVLLFGGVYYYEHVGQPTTPGYTELAWTSAGREDTVAVGAKGADLTFEVVSRQATLTRFRLSAEWEGRSSRPLSAPITFNIDPSETYHGSLFVPAPGDGCMYRVVLTMVAIGEKDPLTGQQQTWTLNANVHKQGVSGNACLFVGAVHLRTVVGLTMTDTISGARLIGVLKRATSDSLVRNSLYLMGSTVTTAGLGYIYWVVAAHIFAKQSIGLSSGVVSMCTTIALLTYLGPSAMLIERLPRMERTAEWTRALYRVSWATVLITCVATAAVAPAILIMSNYRLFYTGPGSILIALAGAGSTTWLNLLATAFVAAGRASRTMLMMSFVSAIKLLLLFPFAEAGAIGLVETWVISNVLGIIVGACWLVPQMRLGRQSGYISQRRANAARLEWQVSRRYARHRRVGLTVDRTFMRRLVGQHLTSVGGFLTPLLLPVAVVLRLGATSNANFYVTWMIGSVFFMVSPSVSTAVFAEGARADSNLGQKVFTALRITTVLLIPAIIAAIIGGRAILRLFGGTYASAGYELLVVLAISAIPDAVSNVAVAVWRLSQKLGYSASLNLGILVAALVGAWLLMPRLGINGAGIAWGGAQLLGAIASLPAYFNLRNPVRSRGVPIRMVGT